MASVTKQKKQQNKQTAQKATKASKVPGGAPTQLHKDLDLPPLPTTLPEDDHLDAPEEEDFDRPPQDLDLDIEKHPGKIVNESGDMSIQELAAIPPELIYTATIWPNLRAPKADLGALWEDPRNRAVIMKFLFFSLVLWIVPFAVFYSVDYLVEDWPNRTLFSGLAAAFSVQIVLGSYIISAIREGDERLDGPTTKRPKAQKNPPKQSSAQSNPPKQPNAQTNPPKKSKAQKNPTPTPKKKKVKTQ